MLRKNRLCVEFLMVVMLITTATVRLSAEPPAATANEQLQRAQLLWNQIYQTKTPQERAGAIRATWEALLAVQQRWPQNTAAVVRSGIMQGDLAFSLDKPRDTVAALSAIIHKADALGLRAGVERRLGEAYERIGEFALAEQHFVAGASGIDGRTNIVEATAVLVALGNFYVRHDRPSDAISMFDRAAELPDQRLVNQMECRLAALRVASKASDPTIHARAADESKILNQLIGIARSTSPDDPAAKTANSIAREIERYAPVKTR